MTCRKLPSDCRIFREEQDSKKINYFIVAHWLKSFANAAVFQMA